MFQFPKHGTFAICMMLMASGHVKDFPKPLFLSLEPTMYSNHIKKIELNFHTLCLPEAWQSQTMKRRRADKITDTGFINS